MSLLVREAGLQSLVVDLGRERGRALGVPLGGAADRAALTLGQALVGNAPNAAALEVAFAGPVLEALHPTACVIFGASFQSLVNDIPVRPGITFTLEAGDILHVGGTQAGARAYLCVAAGFNVPEMLGSRSALEAIHAGDVLTCPPSRTQSRALPFCVGRPPTFLVEEEQRVRVLDGPQADWFPDGLFFAQCYEVSRASNRMGLRLTGEPLTRRAGELVSESVAPGAVQITNDGLPIVLGVDGQTIGGYPKVAHVVRADLDLLGQLRPGARIRFVRVSLDEADAAARVRSNFLREWLTRLHIAERQPIVD